MHSSLGILALINPDYNYLMSAANNQEEMYIYQYYCNKSNISYLRL